MSWSPDGVPISYKPHAVFALSDVEESDYPRCPIRVGMDARKGWAQHQPPRQPFDKTLIAAVRNLVEALARGRQLNDLDGGLGRAAETYQDLHPAIRKFLDVASLNYLEFIDTREQAVGPLKYVTFSSNRKINDEMSLKLWAPVYETRAKTREVHRLRYGTARSVPTTWSRGAAWIVSQGCSQVSVFECGLGDGSDFPLLNFTPTHVIAEIHDRETLPQLRKTCAANKPFPGPDCLRCSAIAVCPVPISMNVLPGMRDETPWVRGLSEATLIRYGVCPAKEFLKAQHLPADRNLTESAERGLRVHKWIAEAHASSSSCADALLIAGTGVPEDAPYLEAHVSVCKRAGLRSLASEQTLVGWDAGIGDVIFMKPDEVLMREDDTLVLREIKTTTKESALDVNIAWQQFSNTVTWWLAVLKGGLLQHFGAARGQVELEVLTPAGGAVHTISTESRDAGLKIAGWALDVPIMWLTDNVFCPNPGPHCSQCDVIRWCTAEQASHEQASNS